MSAACSVLFLFLWVGELNIKAGYRKTISELEEINRNVKTKYQELSEENIRFGNAIDDYEKKRQEAYRVAEATIKELQSDSVGLENEIDRIIEQVRNLEKAVSRLLAVVFD
jgi:predicted nuclease with TOPRIM domain